jgi:hypothetical protein
LFRLWVEIYVIFIELYMKVKKVQKRIILESNQEYAKGLLKTVKCLLVTMYTNLEKKILYKI